MKVPESFYDSRLKQSGVYQIKCAANGRTYIGSAVNMFHRWRSHFYRLEKGTHHNSILQRSWKKHGSEQFAFSVLEYVSREHLRAAEQRHINACGELMNLSPTAGSILGFKMPREDVERRRDIQRKFRHSEETKRLASERRRGIISRPGGWSMSDEQKAKLRKAHSGKTLTAEHRAKIAAAGKRRKGEKRGTVLSRRRFSETDTVTIRQQFVAGKTISELAKEYDCKRESVAHVIHSRIAYSEWSFDPKLLKRRRPALKGKSMAQDQRMKISESKAVRRMARALLAA